MDLGKDVLTRTVLGSTEAEKVFTPWWITVHHYLIYTLVILVPINCMLSTTGSCAYKVDSEHNLLMPHGICRVDLTNASIWIHRQQLLNQQTRSELNATFGLVRSSWSIETSSTSSTLENLEIREKQFALDLQHQLKLHDRDHGINHSGCLIRSYPRIFGFLVYWSCVSQLSPLALYFPYLLLTLALLLVLFERLLTRYLWTGQRIEQFHRLLVKEVLLQGNIDLVDTKENRQRAQQVVYDFKQSNFYSNSYLVQTLLKLLICASLLAWSAITQCNKLRLSFRTEFTCRVFDYEHQCAIPSNGLNLIIFDLGNVVLVLLVAIALFTLSWHATSRVGLRWLQTPLSRLLTSYCSSTKECLEVFEASQDLQMLLNLLAEKEGIWASLLILCLLDHNFRSEFKIRDVEATMMPSGSSRRKRDVSIAWNEPSCAFFIGENIPREHLMYVLEIEPPVNKVGNNVTMLPAACTLDGKNYLSPMDKGQFAGFPTELSRRLTSSSCSSERKMATTSNLVTATSTTMKRQVYASMSGAESLRSSVSSSLGGSTTETANVTIVEGAHHDGRRALSKRNSSALGLWMRRQATKGSLSNEQLKETRPRSRLESVRSFSHTFTGLSSSTDYTISLSFVVSGRKLGTESFTIVSPDNPYRKLSAYSASSIDSNQPPGRSRSETIDKTETLSTCETSDSSGLMLHACNSAHARSVIGSMSGSKLVVVEFSSYWCDLCKLIEPEMEALFEEFVVDKSNEDNILFMRVDTDDCTDLVTEYNVDVLPTILIIRNDKVVRSVIGQMGTLRDTISNILKHIDMDNDDSNNNDRNKYEEEGNGKRKENLRFAQTNNNDNNNDDFNRELHQRS